MYGVSMGQQGPPPPISAGASIPVQTSTVPADHPYATKSLLLYVINQHPACEETLRVLYNRDEVMVIDAMQVFPRPSWLVGVPTIAKLRSADKSIEDVKAGPEAYQLALNYVREMQMRGGAQSTRVMGGSTAQQTGGYQVQPLVSESPFQTPVGIAPHSTTYAGSVDFGGTSDPRYSASTKGISEADIAAYTQRREQRPQPVATQQQWKPSVLANGEMVNM